MQNVCVAVAFAFRFMCACVRVCFTLFPSRSFGFSLVPLFRVSLVGRIRHFSIAHITSERLSSPRRTETRPSFFPFFAKTTFLFFAIDRKSFHIIDVSVLLFLKDTRAHTLTHTLAPIGKSRQNINAKERTKHVTLRDIRRANRKTGDRAVRPRV